MISILKNKNDSEELFKQIYEENFDYVYSFVFSRAAGNASAIEDIVHDTFACAMSSLKNYKGNSSYRTWLCGIAKNKLMEFYRREASRDKLIYIEEFNYLKDEKAEVEAIIVKNETRDVVLKVLNKLKPIYRYVLILKYLDDYSVKDIAKIFSKTPKAIDGILQRSKYEFKLEYSRLMGDDFYEASR